MSNRFEELVRIVHRHYPRNLWVDDPAHAETEETRSLRQAQEKSRQDRERLLSLIRAIEEESPDVRVMDASYLAYDACYTLRLNADPVDETVTGWREVVACISVIAPVFLLYQARIEVLPSGEQRTTASYSPDPEVAPLWNRTADQIARTFGFTLLEPELGLEVVPNVQVQNVPLGEATLYDSLFTPVRD